LERSRLARKILILNLFQNLNLSDPDIRQGEVFRRNLRNLR